MATRRHVQAGIRAAIGVVPVAGLALAAGCQPVVIDERPKNDLFGRLQGSPSARADRVSPGAPGADAALLPPIRQELPDGEIVLRSRTGRDLMVHIQRALTSPDRELERELFTEQVLSAVTWDEFEERGFAPEAAFDELVRRRDDVLKYFNRVGPLAENSPQVLMRMVGKDTIRLQLTGLAREDLAWTFMDMVFEGGNWRLRWFG